MQVAGLAKLVVGWPERVSTGFPAASAASHTLSTLPPGSAWGTNRLAAKPTTRALCSAAVLAEGRRVLSLEMESTSIWLGFERRLPRRRQAHSPDAPRPGIRPPRPSCAAGKVRNSRFIGDWNPPMKVALDSRSATARSVGAENGVARHGLRAERSRSTGPQASRCRRVPSPGALRECRFAAARVVEYSFQEASGADCTSPQSHQFPPSLNSYDTECA